MGGHPHRHRRRRVPARPALGGRRVPRGVLPPHRALLVPRRVLRPSDPRSPRSPRRHSRQVDPRPTRHLQPGSHRLAAAPGLARLGPRHPRGRRTRRQLDGRELARRPRGPGRPLPTAKERHQAGRCREPTSAPRRDGSQPAAMAGCFSLERSGSTARWLEPPNLAGAAVPEQRPTWTGPCPASPLVCAAGSASWVGVRHGLAVQGRCVTGGRCGLCGRGLVVCGHCVPSVSAGFCGEWGPCSRM